MPAWSPAAAPVFDFAEASAYMEACTRAAAVLDEVATLRAARVNDAQEGWRGPRRDAFDRADAAVRARWVDAVLGLRAEALRMTRAAEEALLQLRRHHDDTIRWEQEAAAEAALALPAVPRPSPAEGAVPPGSLDWLGTGS
jgi:predicted secreted protein